MTSPTFQKKDRTKTGSNPTSLYQSQSMANPPSQGRTTKRTKNPASAPSAKRTARRTAGGSTRRPEGGKGLVICRSSCGVWGGVGRQKGGIRPALRNLSECQIVLLLYDIVRPRNRGLYALR